MFSKLSIFAEAIRRVSMAGKKWQLVAALPILNQQGDRQYARDGVG